MIVDVISAPIVSSDCVSDAFASGPAIVTNNSDLYGSTVHVSVCVETMPTSELTPLACSL